MFNADALFFNRTYDADALLAFGFKRESDGFAYSEKILDDSMELRVFVDGSGKVSARIIDLFTDDLYTLHLSDDAVGAFVGDVRLEYERVLTEISERCFEKTTVFRSDGAKSVIAYVMGKYGDKLEFLWDKFPDNAIFRRRDNAKWYAALLTVAWKKLGIDRDGTTEILDLRMTLEEKETLIDGVKYLVGYHMNKNSWLTIILDGRVPDAEIFERIDRSYVLAKKK